MKFRPVGGRVVIRRVKEEQKTSGGIIIPDIRADHPNASGVRGVPRN